MRILTVFVFLLLATATVYSGSRRFTFVYEAPTSPPGVIEVENYVTWNTHTPNNSHFSEVDFRHEIEFGVTDHFQASVYLADWNYHSGSDEHANGVTYTDTAVELIYNFTNPVTDWIGLSTYEEIQAGDRHGELESKLIAQKNFNRLVASYNLTLEADWEGAGWAEQYGELQQALGVSYELSPRFFVGVEAVHEVEFPDWGTAGSRSKFFVGPDCSVRSGRWWVTVTPLIQATSDGDEPRFEVRAATGYTF